MEDKKEKPTSISYIKNKKTEDSLTLLIKSEFFDAHMLFYYLYNNLKPGVQDVLINKLFDTSSDVIEFYINQIRFFLSVLWYLKGPKIFP